MTTTSQRLAGKIAIIVGAGQRPGATPGNGRATAERFAEEGASLLLVDINPDWAEDTRAAVRRIGAEAEVAIADITDEANCRQVVETCLARWGRVDILHNNVGFSKGDAKTAELSLDSWQRIMNANLTGMFLMCKHALPHMVRQQSGSIINVSSTSSLAARPTVTYKTSKGAVNTLTQHIAYEHARHGVRANAILPGLIDTPMAIERRAEETGVPRDVIRRERDALVPIGHMGEAADVANAAVFLASDEARYITGVLLPVDGGLLLKRG
ncbi:MAG: SDR family NAD(P)-dependent oxidoreductase [Pigmentiphaga sp.]|uniref:SDR family NAD(P)-dependent oxidoreductase n=1 Tax=Pigmentiphaga sp. TaxID=1977564 RepID=UPI0029A61EAE|nr:SDR family NAD(P)-dependent oxidoreductase [Pigmentiphaga sp.]MDX3907407.1 SDR family NAD(P)-dependent oxidoreductase [Pigmentiphaga sp.]